MDSTNPQAQQPAPYTGDPQMWNQAPASMGLTTLPPPEPPRRGFQTSEALLTAVSMIVGAALMAMAVFGNASPEAASRLMDIGAVLLGAPVGVYALSRGIAKRGAGFLALPLVAVAGALTLSGCCLLDPAPGNDADYVKRAPVSALLDPVLVRHDTLVRAAVSRGEIDELDARTWLRSSTLLRHLIDERDPTVDIPLPDPVPLPAPIEPASPD